MSCVLYKGKLEESPYKKFFNDNRWDEIHDAVIQACCRLRRVPYRSYLETWYALLLVLMSEWQLCFQEIVLQILTAVL